MIDFEIFGVNIRQVDKYSCGHPNHQDSSFRFNTYYWTKTKSSSIHPKVVMLENDKALIFC